MVRYRCTRCDHGFEAAEARCPRCLRKSSVERETAPPVVAAAVAAPTPEGEKHLKANAWIQSFLIPLHVLTLASVVINLFLMTASAQADSPFSGAYHVPSDPGGQIGFFGTFACIGVWAALGLLWTPFNAWGLFMKRPWARTSTMVYWAGSLVTLCCIPIGLYGLWSLWRPDVAACFRGDGEPLA